MDMLLEKMLAPPGLVWPVPQPADFGSRRMGNYSGLRTNPAGNDSRAVKRCYRDGLVAGGFPWRFSPGGIGSSITASSVSSLSI